MENWDDPFYDGMTQEEKEGFYLHLLANHDGPVSRLGVRAKRKIRDEWMTKRAFDSIPGVQEMKAQEAFQLRQRCEGLYAEMLAFVERVGDEGVVLALADAMRYEAMGRLGHKWPPSGRPDLRAFLSMVGFQKDLTMLTEEDYG